MRIATRRLCDTSRKLNQIMSVVEKSLNVLVDQVEKQGLQLQDLRRRLDGMEAMEEIRDTGPPVEGDPWADLCDARALQFCVQPEVPISSNTCFDRTPSEFSKKEKGICVDFVC